MRLKWGARPPRAQPSAPRGRHLIWRQDERTVWCLRRGKGSVRGRTERQPGRLRSPSFLQRSGFQFVSISPAREIAPGLWNLFLYSSRLISPGSF
jgi:hypothetical protein